MQTGGKVYDSDGWNLDALELNPAFRRDGSGKMLLKKVVESPTTSWRVGLMFNSVLRRTLILVLRPPARVLQSIDSTDPTETSEDILRWQHNRSIDMCVEHRYLEVKTDKGLLTHRSYEASALYLLNRFEGEITRHSWSFNGLTLQDIWSVRPYNLTSTTRIAVVSRSGRRGSVAYVGPCKGGKFIKVDLSGDGRIEEFKMRMVGTRDRLSLGSEVYLCGDNANDSLLISDTKHHLIYEVQCESGEAAIICGTGQRGDSPEGEPAKTAQISAPRALVLYRPGELIDRSHLSVDSLNLLEQDSNKARPRTIIFADSDNLKVKKIVDASAASEEKRTYTLLGSGVSKGAAPEPPDARWEDFKTYPINRPFDLAVSNLGELLIACESTQFLILLRPASTIIRETGHFAGSGYRLHDS
jgi:hypothetical protein